MHSTFLNELIATAHRNLMHSTSYTVYELVVLKYVYRMHMHTCMYLPAIVCIL